MFKVPVTQLRGFLRQQYRSGTFNKFYDGDPNLIPVAGLPCVAVQKTSDRTELGPTGFHRITEELVTEIIFNKADHYT